MPFKAQTELIGLMVIVLLLIFYLLGKKGLLFLERIIIL